MDDYENGVYTFVTKKGRCRANILLLATHAIVELYGKDWVSHAFAERAAACEIISLFSKKYAMRTVSIAQIVECN